MVFSIAVLAAGGFTIRNARVDVLPEFDAPIVEVQAEALGLSAVEVENLVTINLEEILTAAPYLQSISSKSVPGLSSVLLTFEPGTDRVKFDKGSAFTKKSNKVGKIFLGVGILLGIIIIVMIVIGVLQMNKPGE